MTHEIYRAPVAKVEMIGEFEDEYVYDIGIDKETPYFFGNDILVHNSCYFSAYEILKDHQDFKESFQSIEGVIALYDVIADAANETFSDFMVQNFNTTPERGAKIAAGRELLGSTAFFIKKKKYAILMVEYEGKRQDVDGKPGKLKVMGLDLKRSDTPKYMQKFLEEILMGILTDKDQTEMYEMVKKFREDFKSKPAWEKGSPKKVSGMSEYEEKQAKANAAGLMNTATDKLKVNVPWHVQASMMWNKLCDHNNDNHSSRITNDTRIVCCKLKPNAMKIDCIAYPVDQPHLPDWFKSLPFDNAAMEEVIVDMKLSNLVGVLDWDLSKTKESMGEEFFSFGDEPEETMIGHNGGPSMFSADEDEDDD